MWSRLIRAIADGRVQHKIVNLVLPKLLERITGKALHISEVRELERQDGDLVGVLVVVEAAVGFLGGFDVTGAENDAVGLGLLQELLDGL